MVLVVIHPNFDSEREYRYWIFRLERFGALDHQGNHIRLLSGQAMMMRRVGPFKFLGP